MPGARCSDHTGERVRLLRFSAAVALVGVLRAVVAGRRRGGSRWCCCVMFTHTSSMMSLTEAAMAHLVAGDWGRYGRIRLWGSAGFLVTVFVAGEWFERFGMRHFPAWAGGTLALVLLADLAPARRARAAWRRTTQASEPIGPVLRNPAVRWFFASLFFHVMAHFAVYGFLSLYLDSLGYGKGMIGLLWALSVVAEIVWFFLQGRFIGLLPMPRWLLVCGIAAVLRMGLTAGLRRLHRRAGRRAVAARAELRGAPHHLHRDGVAPLSRPAARARAGAVHGDRLWLRRRAGRAARRRDGAAVRLSWRCSARRRRWRRSRAAVRGGRSGWRRGVDRRTVQG